MELHQQLLPLGSEESARKPANFLQNSKLVMQADLLIYQYLGLFHFLEISRNSQGYS